ncbi:nucleoside triphosphate hydrolase [Rhizobium sp. RU36D]|uniref:nucleoside triphosphate hydrolase n=1 Tax=Rhizobium sp. RU36D TaxID=1907415 RepID=UPI0009D8F7FB|nr:nucleoside triphosphate hydrolase [Rhizobium sp. RU36D]SMD04186.1 ArgK protein [Rhizobium sp. RU36D]
MTPDASQLAEMVLAQVGTATRFMVAIAGPPGAGKSTLAESLQQALRERGETAAVLPMDGFHMDNAILIERGWLPRKGAPHTFDVRGLKDVLSAVRVADVEVLVPVFDRSRELAIASARAVSPSDRFILVEGNYLLLAEKPWSDLAQLFDFSIFIAPSNATLESRLRDRWRHYGLSDAAADEKLNENDLPNGRLVLGASRRADVTVVED